MANRDFIFRVVHQPSGHVVDAYDSEKSAIACAERENEAHPEGEHVVVKYVRADLAWPAAPDRVTVRVADIGDCTLDVVNDVATIPRETIVALAERIAALAAARGAG